MLNTGKPSRPTCGFGGEGALHPQCRTGPPPTAPIMEYCWPVCVYVYIYIHTHVTVFECVYICMNATNCYDVKQTLRPLLTPRRRKKALPKGQSQKSCRHMDCIDFRKAAADRFLHPALSMLGFRRGSKYPIFEISGPLEARCFEPGVSSTEIVGTWTPWVWHVVCRRYIRTVYGS